MSRPFLITGLPRSRTAWLSQFMSIGPAVCYHEPLSRLSDISQLPGVFESKWHNFVGVSDSGASLFMPWIMENINPRTVIVERDMSEVDKSLRNIGFDAGDSLKFIQKRLNDFRDHPNVLCVKYDQLDNLRVMQKIFWHLLPGVPFDEDRFHRMCELNITVDVPKLLERSVLYHGCQLELTQGVFKG